METEKVEYCLFCESNQIFMISGSGNKSVCCGCVERKILREKRQEQMREQMKEQFKPHENLIGVLV
jgi:hypothetical protein